MRVITFQGYEVFLKLIHGETYIPDLVKCRERHSYEEDGGAKVWVFADNGMFSHVEDSELFQFCRQEMSINDEGDFCKLVMFELELNESRITPGKTHNGCSYVFVTPIINPSDIVAIYGLMTTRLWYCINALRIYERPNLESIFPKEINTFDNKVHRRGWINSIDTYGCVEIKDYTTCTCCEVLTKFKYKDKYPVCSNECIGYLNKVLNNKIPKKVVDSVMKDFSLTREEAINKIKSRPSWVRFYCAE